MFRLPMHTHTRPNDQQLMPPAVDAPAPRSLQAACSDIVVRWHLRRVERELRARNVRYLPVDLQQRRLRNLDQLQRYWERGIFPRNYERPGWCVPCFIDRHERVCAVAHLMIADGQTALAGQVAAQFNYHRIRAMDAPALQDWAAQSGLTVDELARIQPGYPVEPPYPYMSAWLPYIQAALALGMATIVINAVTLIRERTSWIVPALGLLIGLVLLVFGLVERGAPPDAFMGIRGVENPFGELDVLLGGIASILGGWALLARAHLGKRP